MKDLPTLKMKDVFDGDVVNDGDTLIATGYGILADFSGYKREARYVAHAVNTHDLLIDKLTALTEENAALKSKI